MVRQTTADVAAQQTSHERIARECQEPERLHADQPPETFAYERFASQASAVLTSPCPCHDQQGWGLRALPMILRTRFLITAAFVCHLLLTPSLVTSQLRTAPDAHGSGTAATAPVLPATVDRDEEVRVQAIEQEKDGPLFHLRRHVEIRYGT